LSNLEATGQTILHCSWGVPTLPTQRALIRIIHTLWDTGDPPNERTLAWTYWWTEWLASLLDKGLWTTALAAECQGIDKLALLFNTYRFNPRVVKVASWYGKNHVGGGVEDPHSSFCLRVPLSHTLLVPCLPHTLFPFLLVHCLSTSASLPCMLCCVSRDSLCIRIHISTIKKFTFFFCLRDPARGGTGSLAAVRHLNFRNLENCVQWGTSNVTVEFLLLKFFFFLFGVWVGRTSETSHKGDALLDVYLIQIESYWITINTKLE